MFVAAVVVAASRGVYFRGLLELGEVSDETLNCTVAAAALMSRIYIQTPEPLQRGAEDLRSKTQS